MSYVNKLYRTSSDRRRVASAEPNGPKQALEALQAALGADGDPKPKLHKKTGASGGSSSGGADTSGSSRGAEDGSGADKARSGAAGKPGLFDELGLPAKPTQAQIDKLTRDILEGVDQDSGMSDGPLSLLDPTTLTPLQRALFTALNGMSKEELERHPELLAAVRAGFATEGGQQLAVILNLLDADIVGDLGHPSRRRLLDGTSLIHPESLARLVFNIPAGLPPSVLTAATAWIAAAQGTAEGRSRLRDLVRGGPVSFRLDDGSTPGPTARDGGRTVTLSANPGAIDQDVQQGLNAIAEAAVHTRDPQDWSMDPVLLVEDALIFDDTVPLETQRLLKQIAKHSPTLRNVLLRSVALHGKVRVSIDDGMSGAALFSGDDKQIRLRPGSPEELASNIVFELGNSANNGLLKAAARLPRPPGNDDVLMDTAVDLQIKRMQRSPQALQTFMDWIDSDSRDEIDDPQPIRPRGANETELEYRNYLLRNRPAIEEFLSDYYGRNVVFDAAHHAIAIELQENNTLLLHVQVSSEVKESLGVSDEGVVPRGLDLSPEAIEALEKFEAQVEQGVEGGNFHDDMLAESMRDGHTSRYFEYELEQAEGLPFFQRGSALAEAGAAAGTAAHTDVRAAAATHGPTNRAAIAEAAEATLWQRSQALAAQMLEHPAVKNVLRATGRGLEAAALAVMAYDLAKAIHTDVKNGDRSAPATRKALAELLGGVSLGVGVGAAGAATGAALGSLAGPIGAAVGGFIGGLFGGALGFAAGTRLVDRALENNKKPLDHLIDSVLDQQGDIAAVNAGAIGALQTLTGSGGGLGTAPDRTPEPKPPAEPSQDQLNLAQRVVQAGSTNDDYANRKELIAGFEEARYQLKAGQPGTDFSDAFPVNRLIATYGASGSGALTEDELAQALADGALVLHDDGTVTVDTAVLHARQRSHAGHIASRVVDAGAKAETADEGDLRDGFGEAGYSLKASGKDIDALMRVFGDANGRIGKSALAAAIQVGAVVIAADGTVRVDRAVLDLAA
jgi:hypothetical protein